MQSKVSKKIANGKRLNNFSAVGGDPGISFYSASSVNDTMMDTSGVVISSAK